MMTDRLPTLVTYRAAEALRDEGIRYAYFKVGVHFGLIVAFISVLGATQFFPDGGAILWPLAAVALSVAGYCQKKTEFPRYLRLTLAELETMSNNMGLPRPVIEQTIGSVLIGSPEELAALPRAERQSTVHEPGTLVAFPTPLARGGADDSVRVSRDVEQLAENIAELQIKKRKTPEEFQSLYDTRFRKHKKQIMPFVLVVPGLIVTAVGALFAYNVPTLVVDGFLVGKLLVVYLILVAAGWATFIECERPGRNEGHITRKILEK